MASMTQTQLGFREEKKRITRAAQKTRGPGKENIPPGEPFLHRRTRRQSQKPVIDENVPEDVAVISRLPTPPQSPPSGAKRENSSPVRRERTESPVKRECLSSLGSLQQSPLSRMSSDSPVKTGMELRNSPLKRAVEMTPPPVNRSAVRELTMKGSLSCSAAGSRVRRRTDFPGYLQYQHLKTALCKEERPTMRREDSIEEESTESSCFDLPGRAAESAKLRLLVKSCISERRSASLYISGPPGTGKSASVTTSLRNYIKEHGGATLHVVNCVRCRTQQSISESLGCGEEGPVSSSKSKDRPLMVIILDEVDQVEHQNFLYKMFEWVSPAPNRSPMLLIAIANALDLTDRLLPRLSISKVKPELMHFKPYSAHDLKLIIEDRIKAVQKSDGESGESGWSALLDRGAIELCARKVAASTGDARKALDICRRAVEIVQNEAMRQHLAVQAMATPPMSPAGGRGPINQPPVTSRVTVAVMSRVINESNNNNNLSTPARHTTSSAASVQEKCPVHHRLVIAAVAKLISTHPAPHYSLSQVFSKYSTTCQEHSFSSLDQSQFLMVLSLLEARGILDVSSAREFRTKKLIVKGNFLEFASQEEMKC